MGLGPSLALWACRQTTGAAGGLSRRALGLVIPRLSPRARAEFLTQLDEACEALRAAGRTGEALALVAVVDVGLVPELERAEAASSLRRLEHRLLLTRVREVDLGARSAELVLQTLAGRLDESGARALPARVGAHHEALMELMALNLLREPFVALASRPPEEVFDVALASVASVRQQTMAWGSLGPGRVLRELESLLAQLRDAMASGPGAGLGPTPARADHPRRNDQPTR